LQFAEAKSNHENLRGSSKKFNRLKSFVSSRSHAMEVRIL